jgi:hypothetical protein
MFTRFVAQNCTHLWKGFANRLYLVFHAIKIPWVQKSAPRNQTLPIYGQSYTKTEFLDSKPHTEENKETRKRTLIHKNRTKLPSCSPFKLQIFKHSPSRPPRVKHVNMIFKATPPRRIWRQSRHRRPSDESKKGFHPENQRTSSKHLNKRLQGGSRHPNTPSLLTPTP